MLNNSGTYGPNESPTDMVASLNRSQSTPSKTNHNLNSFGKIVQQAASSAGGNYETHNFPNFGAPPVGVPPLMHPFQAYQTMGHASSYFPQNSPFTYENAIPDYFPAVSTSAQVEHHNNMLNFRQSFLMNSSHELQIASENESCVIKNYPLNIPQMPTRIYERTSTIDKNDFQNVPQNSTILPDTILPLPTGFHQSSNSGNSDLINPENLSQSRRISPENTLDIPPSVIVKNDLESPENLSRDVKMSPDHLQQNSTSVIQRTSTFKIESRNSVNYNQSSPTMFDNCISEKKRKSLEKTVRLIESILIKSTNNNTKSNVIENKTDDPLALSPESDLDKKKSDTQTNETEDDYSDSDDEVLIKKLPTEKAEHAKKSPPKMIESLRRSHVIENETDIQIEHRIKQEIENVIIKEEYTGLSDIDYNNPFHRDSNGLPRNAVGDAKVIDMENSVEEALETIKNGGTSLTYFECPYCSLLLFHPKRFLVHSKWHCFGLLNEKRAEIAREREDRIREKREARIRQRLSMTEATGVEEDTFPCKDCNKAFQTRNGLKNHRRRVHPAEVTECRICLLPVPGLKELRLHMSTHEDKVAGFHQCPHCPKRFKYRHSLAKHSDTHLEKTHGCPECSKMFGSAQLVKLHMKTHERMARGTTYHCSYCGKGFYETYNLNVHERTHRNIKPYKCDICGSCFVTNSSLKRHVKVSHSGAKPYTCKECLKCFSTESIRDRHELRVHSDQKQFPHQCQLCPRRYMKPKDLRNHMYKMHTKEKKKRSAVSESDNMSS